ncbi:helix-turn-helix transcriptional regulator [Herbiconiux flava]|uniref:DNA-binding CsgD family transcriptional regulator n=1 Tax=Herbiconiux flava TaxID=881268 RepID=A0A852SRL7_9MICO|nr:helix-turn-helix transcriptional regulator [Herbiconiux flava]NYD71422.1 DNA-binding CsgD family transcriptional regulator [Herbiconiux flava]GLK18614.1 hypothetical protein GCM10017602_30960 [Herbiconiux flava]
MSGAAVDLHPAATAAVLEGRGVFVSGGAGWGRTHFVHRLLEGAGADGRERMWIGDDVHLLDAQQAEKLAQAVQSGRLVPLGTVLRSFPLPPALERLVRDGEAVRLELPEPGIETMHRVVEETLGGILSPDSVPSVVPARPGGDLVVLRAAVVDLKAVGALALSGGRWSIVDPIPPRDGLRRLVHARLSTSVEVTSSIESILDIVALAPGLTADDIVEAMVSPGTAEDLERLEREGIVDVSMHGGPSRLTITDPVIELVLPWTVGRLRKERLGRAIADVLSGRDPDGLAPEQLAALARHALPSGRPVDRRALLLSAVAAFESSQVELSLQLATAAGAAGGGVDAEIVVAACEWRLGHPDQASTRLQAARMLAAGDAVRSTAISTLGALMSDTAGSPGFGWDRPSGSPMPSEAVDLAALLRLGSRRHSMPPTGGGHTADADRLRDVVEAERLRQAAENAALSGDLRTTNAFLDAAESLLDGVGGDTFVVRLNRAFARSLDGAMEENLAVIGELRDQARVSGRPVQHAVATWILGHRLLYSGRCRLALTELLAAQELMTRAGMNIGTGLSSAEVRIAEALTGASARSDGAATGSTQAPAGHPFVVAPTEHQARGWEAAVAGDCDEAARHFVAAAEAYEELGHFGAAMLPWAEAARAGSATVVLPRIEALAALVQGENSASLVVAARALARYERLTGTSSTVERADARARSVADELSDAGERTARAGFHLHAAELFSRCEKLRTRHGPEREAAAASRRVDQELEICDLTESPFLEGHSRSPLSGRERELAVLAASGLSNREISEALVLSVRTVETHLLRVYRKLGIRTRSELPGAIGQTAPGERSLGAATATGGAGID